MSKLAIGVLLTAVIISGASLFAGKPGSEPPPPEPSSRFACFTVQNHGNTVCFDRTDRYLVRGLAGVPGVVEVFPYGGQQHNVLGTVEDVTAALE